MASDLWGFGQLDVDGLKGTSYGILKEQKEIFENKTSGILKIEINSRKLVFKDQIKDYKLATNFDIVAPALDRYSYTLFSMFSKAEKDYPLALINSFEEEDLFDGYHYTCNNEAEFIDALNKILSSEETTAVVKNLYSKSVVDWN
jgi:hypothetical protein